MWYDVRFHERTIDEKKKGWGVVVVGGGVHPSPPPRFSLPSSSHTQPQRAERREDDMGVENGRFQQERR